MQHQTLPLADLHAHPANANSMPDRLYRKLVEHLRDSGHYPPLIVRPLGENAGYQLLDGHHRAKALAELGHDTADCVVWPVDEARALVLLATLNRLAGDDDPVKRGRLIERLQATHALPDLARLLPEDTAKLKALVGLTAQPTPHQSALAAAELPVAVHFFLTPAQRDTLEAKLRAHGGPRGEALLNLIEMAKQ